LPSSSAAVVGVDPRSGLQTLNRQSPHPSSKARPGAKGEKFSLD
jgi:hypothetical protein